MTTFSGEAWRAIIFISSKVIPDTDVSVQVWYDVGSKENPPERSGLAHLVEHLMFKGTRDMPPEYIDQLTERGGGFGNASTNVDYTEFHEPVPTSQLETILWAEAQRMDGLVIRPADLAAERAVVEFAADDHGVAGGQTLLKFH